MRLVGTRWTWSGLHRRRSPRRSMMSGTGQPTLDQAGNVWEFSESVLSPSRRVIRGGSSLNYPSLLGSGTRASYSAGPASGRSTLGFRLITVISGAGVPTLVGIGWLGLGVRTGFWAGLASRRECLPSQPRLFCRIRRAASTPVPSSRLKPASFGPENQDRTTLLMPATYR